MIRKIVVREKIEKNSTLITAFPSVGLSPLIAGQYLISKWNAKKIGFLDIEGIPPVGIIDNGVLIHPVRIYKAEKHSSIILVSEFPIPNDIIPWVAEEISSWAFDQGIKEVYAFESTISNIGTKVISNLHNMDKKTKDVEVLKNGVIMGLSPYLLLELKDLNIPAVCIIAQSSPNYPDAKAAINILETFSKLSGKTVDLEELRKEAEAFESKISNIMETTKKLQESHEKLLYG